MNVYRKEMKDLFVIYDILIYFLKLEGPENISLIKVLGKPRMRKGYASLKDQEQRFSWRCGY